MSQWEIALEPEVESWLDELSFPLYQRVMRNVDDYLVIGGIPDGDHVKKLKDAEGVHELRVALDRTTWRLTFWKPSDKAIVILTAFRKAQEGTQAPDIARAIAAKKRCEAEHDLTTTHVFERSA
ncbi:type II toxin-antitoxin system RelE/ParE family toxin [Nonomuraea salmonea]|jgi:hypothetical protein|uniref:Type II toxin-antitoxin system RelE/ParE family toxin n=2 Tax=Nonomuraea salmonea TaxID=46181 RepID=A0ABV5NVH3_9ACTN